MLHCDYYNSSYDLRGILPEAGIKGRDKKLHPTVSVGCNYLSLPLIPASVTTVLISFAHSPHHATQLQHCNI